MSVLSVQFARLKYPMNPWYLSMAGAKAFLNPSLQLTRPLLWNWSYLPDQMHLLGKLRRLPPLFIPHSRIHKIPRTLLQIMRKPIHSHLLILGAPCPFVILCVETMERWFMQGYLVIPRASIHIPTRTILRGVWTPGWGGRRYKFPSLWTEYLSSSSVALYRACSYSSFEL